MADPESIAIDGPVAAGKTALGKALAQRLKYRFLDTGMMYRVVTWMALEQGLDTQDEENIVRIAQAASIRPDGSDGTMVFVDERRLGDELRRPNIDRSVSQVSAYPGVRTALVQQQRAVATEGPVVMVGRDIGTVVLPNAPLKLFMIATAEERAKRRHLEMAQKGSTIELQQVLNDLEIRDRLDEGRARSPLRPAEDAVLLNTDGKDLSQVIEIALGIIMDLS